FRAPAQVVADGRVAFEHSGGCGIASGRIGDGVRGLLVGGVDGGVEEVDDPALDGLPQSVLRAEVVGDEPDGHPRLGGDGAQGSAGEAVGREEVEAGIADAGTTGEVPAVVL